MQNNYIESYKLILSEIDKTLSEVNKNEVKKLINAIIKAEKIFVVGAGRMGIVLSTFCMRLYQLGFNSFVVGMVNCPPISSKDLLLVASSSGEMPTTLQIVKKANQFGAKIFTITANLKSTIAKLSSDYLYLRGPSSIEDSSINTVFSKQPMKTLFSQSLFILLESLVIQLMKITSQNADDLAKKHTNLE